VPDIQTHWIEPGESDESRLAIDLVTGTKRPARLWFFVHGLNSTRRGDKARYIAEQIIGREEAFASLDLTGHGESDGDLRGLTLSRNIHDVGRGLDYVKQRSGPYSAVYLVGSSMGGITGAWYSANRPGVVRANILIAPAFEMAGRLLLGLGPKKSQRFRSERVIHLDTEYASFDLDYGFVEDESRYPVSKLVERLQTPTLIVHGSNDESVPCQLSRRFAAKSKVVKFIEIEGGDHRLTDHKELLFEEMIEFVKELESDNKIEHLH
jgi:pimeloyl-ACP methyl ester carboxylesterase